MVNGILSQQVQRQSIWVAGLTVAVILLATAILLPISGTQLADIPPLLPMFATAVFIIENLTVYFLLTQFHSTREPFLAALSGAYEFVAILVIFQLLIFPGVFSETGLLGAGPQSSGWIWLIWHGGFPLFVFLALLTRLPYFNSRSKLQYQVSLLVMFSAPLTAIVLSYLVLAEKDTLPVLLSGFSYFNLLYSPFTWIVLALNLLALLTCLHITRLRELLSLWLAIALITSLADLIISVSASSRYSLGWYAGRSLSLASSSMVLGVLIWEISHLYRQLVNTNQALAERVIRDSLTGAFNRGYFIEHFPREVQRAIRERDNLSLLMVDVDHFKAYNDTYGHQLGDECLISMIGLIQNIIQRPADYVARYGGEEFVVVLPGTDLHGALQVAEAISAAVATFRLGHTEEQSHSITVSIGVASLDQVLVQDKPNAEALIYCADQALYQAKQDGRNACRVFVVPDAEDKSVNPFNIR